MVCPIKGEINDGLTVVIERALREAACWVSDIGSHDHPEYRAEQAFLRVLRQHGVGLDHHARAFLALVAALRYEAEPNAPYLAPTRVLLSISAGVSISRNIASISVNPCRTSR